MPWREVGIAVLGGVVAYALFPVIVCLAEGNLGTYAVLLEPLSLLVALPSIALSIALGRWLARRREILEAVFVSLAASWILVSASVYLQVQWRFADDGASGPAFGDVITVALIVLTLGGAGWAAIAALVVLPLGRPARAHATPGPALEAGQ